VKPALEKLLAAIVFGLILPLLLFRFRVNPWSEPFRYWGVFVLCFGIAYLVYKYRQQGEGRISLRAHLINSLISLVVLCVVAVAYALILALLFKVV